MAVATEPLILIVDDEPRIRRLVRLALEREGWRVVEAGSGAEAVLRARDSAPACVLLDIVLPDLDGFQVVAQIREFSAVPVIFLTGRGAEDDRVQGLDLGADDYVTKPFGVRELVARVRANLRRERRGVAAPFAGSALTYGPLTIDFPMRRAALDGKPLALTPTEFGLLAQLARHTGQVLLPADLLRAVWGPAYVDDVGLLRTAIWRLRRKLERDVDHPRYVLTVPRVGYTFGGDAA